jgi:ferredoxin
MGPPLCDELLALVEHMFTEDEADVVRHIKPWKPKTAAHLADASGRPLAEVREILDRLANQKHVIFSFGKGDGTRYFILPIVPGTFESVLVRKSPDSVTPWHKRFAELYEALYDTGYLAAYNRRPVNAVRYLPVGEAVKATPMALPSDRLEEIMERYSDFAVGVCQCRLSKRLVGDGCGRMLETCTVMGEFAPRLIDEGRMRRASREEVLEIKAAAEKEGLVTWMLNDESSRLFKCSCSCCGCCCGALRQIAEFSAPGMIAPPHFMPRLDPRLCNNCGKCAKACHMRAVEVSGEGEAKRYVHHAERCIGCGVCVVSCPQGALSMVEVPGYREPPSNILAYLARHGHNYMLSGLQAWSARRRGGERLGGKRTGKSP